MRIAILFLCVLAAPVLANQTIWKWVDERGVTHYSDRPVPGATPVVVATSSSRSTSGDSSARSYSSSPPATSPSQEADANGYQRFEIASPQANDTLANTGGEVRVSLRLEPRLNSGHSLVLYMDGRLVTGFPPTALDFEMKEVARGTHSLVAVVQDGRGRRIQETAPVTFTVRQESATQPPVGPTLRPPPKPTPRGANKLPDQQPSYAALNGTPAAKVDPRTNLPAKPELPPAGPRRGN